MATIMFRSSRTVSRGSAATAPATRARHGDHGQSALEHPRGPPVLPHAVVALEQLVEGLLMGVPGLGEIGDVGQRGAAQEGGSLGGAEREALADERRVV